MSAIPTALLAESMTIVASCASCGKRYAADVKVRMTCEATEEKSVIVLTLDDTWTQRAVMRACSHAMSEALGCRHGLAAAREFDTRTITPMEPA